MLQFKMFKRSIVDQLSVSIMENLECYRRGNFHEIVRDPNSYISSEVRIAVDNIELFCMGPHSEDTDRDCCVALWDMLPPGSLPRSVARDERLWVYLTHDVFLDYSRLRWPIPSDDKMAISHVRRHFFAKTARGLERDNAISRLWWMSAICSNVSTMPLDQVLEVFLYMSDVRANVVERPTTSQNPKLLESIVSHLKQSYDTDKGLFQRERFREFMKQINLAGGVKLLDGINEAEIMEMVDASKKEAVLRT